MIVAGFAERILDPALGDLVLAADALGAVDPEELHSKFRPVACGGWVARLCPASSAPPDLGLDPGGALGIAVGERADVDEYWHGRAGRSDTPTLAWRLTEVLTLPIHLRSPLVFVYLRRPECVVEHP
jgi:hypothetical protein